MLPSLRPLVLVLALSMSAAHAAEPVELKFDELVHQPVGPRGIEFSDKVLAARGQLVRIAGYMVRQEVAEAGRFLLAPQPVALSEHADGPANDLPITTFTVLLAPSQAQRIVAPVAGRIELVGRLQMGRSEAVDGSVSWLRLQLAPDALLP